MIDLIALLTTTIIIVLMTYQFFAKLGGIL